MFGNKPSAKILTPASCKPSFEIFSLSANKVLRLVNHHCLSFLLSGLINAQLNPRHSRILPPHSKENWTFILKLHSIQQRRWWDMAKNNPASSYWITTQLRYNQWSSCWVITKVPLRPCCCHLNQWILKQQIIAKINLDQHQLSSIH